MNAMPFASVLLLLASPGVAAQASLVQGPAQICARESSFEMTEGERVSSAHGGIHIGRMTITTARGEIEYAEGDAWAPTQGGTRVRLSSGLNVRRTERSNGEIGYAVYARPSSRHPLVWITGSALDGSHRDKAILQRVRLQPFDPSRCMYSVDYGWHLILGPEQ